MSASQGSVRPLQGTPLDEAAAGLDLCVHCGFCLQSCPTYLALDDENDSPRGRLLLMRTAVEGDLDITDPSLREHIDRCLGCRACESACPSGVPYGRLLEATRATFAERTPPPLIARLVLGTMASAPLRAMAMGLARLARGLRVSRLLARLPGRVGFAFAMLEATRPVLIRRSVSPVADAAGGTPARGTVATLAGCVMAGLFAHTNRATARALSRNGYRVVDAPGQGCCGALHAHAGLASDAAALAQRCIAAFEQSGADWIAVNSAGCGAMMKEYGHLLHNDSAWGSRAARCSERVRDVSELLALAGPAAGTAVPLTVAYDAACHLLHAQRVSGPPLKVLESIVGLTLVPLSDAERCCGGAGIFTLVQPEVSDAVLSPKIENVRRSGAAVIATGNPGCHMQIGAGLIRAGLRIRCVHPVELLDASYAAMPGDA